MSRITIKDIAEPKVVAFDSTDNVVLMPLAVTDSTEGSRLCTSVSDLNTIENVHTADNGKQMAINLVNAGLKVLIKFWKPDTVDSETTFEQKLIAAIKGGLYKEFEDNINTNIKFITTGATAVCNADVLNVFQTIVDKRNCDCIVLADCNHTSTTETAITDDLKTLSAANNHTAITVPCIKVEGINDVMPGSYGYLMAYANSVHNNPNWISPAGIQRGIISGLTEPVMEITESFMHLLQNDGLEANRGEGTTTHVFANCIMKKGNHGIRLWGNRTAEPATNSTSYLNYLNVVLLACDIHKQIYDAAIRHTFEPNDDITWISFKNSVNTLLDKMMTGRGIKRYNWKRENTNELGTISAKLTITPIEAVENFDITINLTDETVEIA